MHYKLAFAFLLASRLLLAQNDASAGSASRVAKSTEFAIPSSPAFNMLNGNTPSRIERYASLHDVKVDWSLTNGQAGYTLSPGLGLEVQPVWMLFFDRAAAAKYRRAAPIVRTLSTLSLSAGTNGSNSRNWLAWAAKINLYRQHDPLNDPQFLKEVERASKVKKDSLLKVVGGQYNQRHRLNKRDKDYKQQYEGLSDTIETTLYNIRQAEREQGQRLVEAREQYVSEHWNASYLDFAFGRLLRYEQIKTVIAKTYESPTVPGQVDTVSFVTQNSLKLDQQGYGAWLSGGIGLGRHVMLSGMLRYAKKPSVLADTIGQQLSFGTNFRYGSHRYNFFIETFYDQESYPLSEAPGLTLERKFFALTVGGDWRISHNVMLSFGIRRMKDLDTGTFLLQPMININCMMR